MHPVLVPRTARSPSIMSMNEWLNRYDSFLENIWNSMRTYIESNTNSYISNPDEVIYRLEVYLYKTSINKFRRYTVIK